jgi:hypothetical protein
MTAPLDTAPAANAAADNWTVAGRTFTSRLIVGTGKYKDYATNAAAAEAAGAEIVTVAVRRVNISDPSQPLLMDFVKPAVSCPIECNRLLVCVRISCGFRRACPRATASRLSARSGVRMARAL